MAISSERPQENPSESAKPSPSHSKKYTVPAIRKCRYCMKDMTGSHKAHCESRTCDWCKECTDARLAARGKR